MTTPRRRAAALALAVLTTAALAGCNVTENGGGAYVACQYLIEDQLKAPSTAEFGGVEYDPPPAGEGDGTWTLTGWVDAENSFGGTVRNEWICSVDVSDNGETYSNGEATILN